MHIPELGNSWSTEKDPWGGGLWPAHWIRLPNAGHPPKLMAYRCTFDLPKAELIQVAVSADERYKLYLDGKLVSIGVQRCDPGHWPFRLLDWNLEAGKHTLIALVWALGHEQALAQVSVSGGRFILAARPPFAELLNTGRATWHGKLIRGYRFTGKGETWGTPSRHEVNGAEYPWGFEKGLGDDWQAVEKDQQGRSRLDWWGMIPARLEPATLPAMLYQPAAAPTVRYATGHAQAIEASQPVQAQWNNPELARNWQAMLETSAPLIIGPKSHQRILLDWNNYQCGYTQLIVSGGKGSRISLEWAESLYESRESQAKGHRDQVEGKFFRGVGNAYLPDGGEQRFFEPLWWEAGRYVQVQVTTADEPVVIQRLSLMETRYPLDVQSRFEFDDDRLNQAATPMLRTLEMCSHETFMDCPYYEQLMYVGDSRLEALATYMLTADDRLPRQALKLFDSTRMASGLVRASFSKAVHVLPGFALWWIGMVYDYALWRGDEAFVRSLLPGVRAALDHVMTHTTDDHLVAVPDGWHFVDWVPSWNNSSPWPVGTPSAGNGGVCGIFNWQFVLALNMAAELDRWLGEKESAMRWQRLARQYAKAIHELFWNQAHGLYADDLHHQHFSQHAQCLAILTGLLPLNMQHQLMEKTLSDASLAQTTIYFRHYLFEALGQLGMGDQIVNLMEPWFALNDQGFKTIYESPGEPRSDCHAWGSHPLYHYGATLLGIRPDGMGFDSVRISPQLDRMQFAKAQVMHPRLGLIRVTTDFQESHRGYQIELPPGLHGRFVTKDHSQLLSPGSTFIELPMLPAPDTSHSLRGSLL